MGLGQRSPVVSICFFSSSQGWQRRCPQKRSGFNSPVPGQHVCAKRVAQYVYCLGSTRENGFGVLDGPLAQRHRQRGP